MSLPTRGAWIEIGIWSLQTFTTSSLPTRGAWIEIPKEAQEIFLAESLPTRGAWIEIPVCIKQARNLTVAPHTGSVD